MSVLIIAAHPDDEVLGCGGTAAWYARSTKVNTLILTSGDTYGSEVHAQATEAARCLGIHPPTILSYPDQLLDTIPLKNLAGSISKAIELHKPTLVLTHCPSDINQDHAAAFHATAIATRPYATETVEEVLCYEVPSSTECLYQQASPPFIPNVFIDIHPYLPAKLVAMRCYGSRGLKQFPHPRSRTNIEAIAAHRGAAAGLRAAEAFTLLRTIRRIRF